MAELGRLGVEWDGDRVLVAAPDGPGVLSKTAGVLALHSLDVLSAAVATHAGMAVNAFTVAPRFGSKPDASLLRQDLGRVLDGVLSLAERLTAKERAYERPDIPVPPPRVLWFDREATDASVVELRAADSFGLLHRVTATLERSSTRHPLGPALDARVLGGRRVLRDRPRRRSGPALRTGAGERGPADRRGGSGRPGGRCFSATAGGPARPLIGHIAAVASGQRHRSPG